MPFLMLIHVACGTLAVLAGFIAMCAPKGKPVHVKSGQVYMVTMLGMAIAGGAIALLLPQSINVFASLLTIYLVITSWHAGRNNKIVRRSFEIFGCIFICVLAFFTLKTGLDVMHSEQQHLHGFGYNAFFVIGTMALVAAIGDVSLMLRGEITGKQRILRHLWRMCLSYFIAAGSLFEGPGVKVFPEVIKESGILGVPVPLIMLFTLYWILKTLLPKLNFSFGR